MRKHIHIQTNKELLLDICHIGLFQQQVWVLAADNLGAFRVMKEASRGQSREFKGNFAACFSFATNLMHKYAHKHTFVLICVDRHELGQRHTHRFSSFLPAALLWFVLRILSLATATHTTTNTAGCITVFVRFLCPGSWCWHSAASIWLPHGLLLDFSFFSAATFAHSFFSVLTAGLMFDFPAASLNARVRVRALTEGASSAQRMVAGEKCLLCG